MLNLFLAPFQFPFMVNAIAISIVVAIPCALLSVFLVLKGWALMGDAMSHAVFPGVVLAYIIGIPFAIGAFIAGLLCAVTTGFLDDNSRLKRDTIMGIVFSGMFGAGLVLYVAIQSDVHLDHILFGDMLGISLRDIGQTTAIALVIALIIGLKWRDFLLHAFDPTQAKASGLRGGLLHYGLLCMIALTIVATLQSVGIILSISLLIAPRGDRASAGETLYPRPAAGGSGGHRLLGGRGVAGVLSRQRASADYRGAVYRAVCGRLCRKHDPR